MQPTDNGEVFCVACGEAGPQPLGKKETTLKAHANEDEWTGSARELHYCGGSKSYSVQWQWQNGHQV